MIIAIEGIDGSGKNTQAALLVENLKKLGYSVSLIGFPRYSETFFGKEVGDYLNGKYGGIDDIHPKLVSLLYAGDRFETKEYIEKQLSKGVLLVIDRYVASNVAHQGAKLSPSSRDQFLKWAEMLEFDVFGLPRPKMNILLDIDVVSSTSLVMKKNIRNYTDKKKDLHEENTSYLVEVAAMYRKLAKQDNWYDLKCLQSGKLRSINDISKEILDIVLPVLKHKSESS